MLGLLKKGYKPRVKDVVKVNTVADRKNLYRLDPSVPYRITNVDKRNEEVKVVKIGHKNDRGVEGWTVFFSDIEPLEIQQHRK